MNRKLPTNAEIARLLERVASLLETRKENPFRIQSYRSAAASVRTVKESVARLVQTKGAVGLQGLRGIGEKLAGLIGEYVETGKVKILEDLEKEMPPAEVDRRQTTTKPGKGTTTLLVDVILDVDAEYRKKAVAGKLKMISPKKFNPEGKAWLPILATERSGWKFTAMYSNTARAHDLEKTHDWVVIYFQKDGGEEQCTVVTDQKGPLKGKRVVRGREIECAAYYA